jgi:nitrate/nitrite transporter NarK
MMIILAPVAGLVSDRVGSFRLTATAFVFMTGAYLIFSNLQASSGPALIGLGLAVLGAGMAMFGSPNSSSILGSVPTDKSGYAGGFISTIRNLSYCAGTATSVSVFTWSLARNSQTHGFTPAYIHATHMVY